METDFLIRNETAFVSYWMFMFSRDLLEARAVY